MDRAPSISIVVPAYNEIESLPELYQQLHAVLSGIAAEIHLLVVDDASTDGTLEWLRKTSRLDNRLAYVSFTRNFGHQAAVTAGLQHAAGDAVIVMDADLQDPPQVVPLMIDRWREGFQIVMGQRVERKVDSWSKRILAWGFYRVLAQLSEIRISVDSGDFCLMDRLVVDTLNKLPERHRYIRGLRAWVGFRHTDLPFARRRRIAGKPKYNFVRSLGLALDGIVSFSRSPLRFATYTGLATGLLALAMMGMVLYWRLFTNAPLVGITAIITVFLFIASVQLVASGIMGEYIGRIYDEVKGRPHYVIKEISRSLALQSPLPPQSRATLETKLE